jgi:hypothetical protein
MTIRVKESKRSEGRTLSTQLFFQIGITVIGKCLGHHVAGARGTEPVVADDAIEQGGAIGHITKEGKKMTHTIDGDGNALSEDVAISADKGRDLGEGVRLLEVLGRAAGGDLDLLELEAVGLRDSADGRRAGVALEVPRRKSATMHAKEQEKEKGNARNKGGISVAVA